MSGLTPEKKATLKGLMGSCKCPISLSLLCMEERYKMSIKPLIELITCESGDWEVLRIKTDEVDMEYSGHSIGNYIWLETMRDYLGCDIAMKEISDEDMEIKKY